MHQSTRLAQATLARVAAAALALAAALSGGEARAAEPTGTWPAAPGVIDPSVACDYKTDAQIEQAFEVGRVMPLSSYDDDPSVADAIVECLPGGVYPQTTDERVLLENDRVTLAEESYIYRLNHDTGLFDPYAWNPWPQDATSNDDGSFRFPDEPRFPLLATQRGPDGKPIRRDGLLVFTPNDLRRGSNTVFDAANGVKNAAEDWAGRSVAWGNDGVLLIEPHVFWDFNAFYSPFAHQVFFGIVGYRLPGETDVKVFETATSWEMAAHEVGHAVHDALKPNSDQADLGWETWGESFADQIELWTQLRDPSRVRALLAGPSLHQSNALSELGEAWGYLVGDKPAERDALNDATISNTSDEVHDRSEVLTGALYQLFLGIYEDLKGQGDEKALDQAGTILGLFAIHATEHTPEDRMTLEDVAKGYLTVDAELFGGRYHDRLVAAFQRREIFDAHSDDAWRAHQAALPNVRLPYGVADKLASQVVGANLDRLGVGPDFGLTVQSVVRDKRFRRTIVRVQLTQGRGPAAAPLADHGILVFRENGTLADWQAPLPFDGASDADAVSLLGRARQVGLDAHGAPLSLVRGADGALDVEARSVQGDGPSVWVDAYTLDAPDGERRAIASTRCIGERQSEAMARAGIVLDPDAMGE